MSYVSLLAPGIQSKIFKAGATEVTFKRAFAIDEYKINFTYENYPCCFNITYDAFVRDKYAEEIDSGINDCILPINDYLNELWC